MNKKQEEQLEFIKVANDLNQKMYEKNEEVEDKFFYLTDGYNNVFGFGEKTLWSSQDDDRDFIEDKNDYEDFQPYIIKKFNDWIESLGKLAL